MNHPSHLANFFRLNIILTLLGLFLSPASVHAGSSTLAAQANTPALASLAGDLLTPLPRDCNDVTPPGDPPVVCCLFGYVTVNGVPVAGAQVTVTGAHGSVVVTTQSGPDSGFPYYHLVLSTSPLNVQVGDTLTITVSYTDRTAAFSHIAQPFGQQVDLPMPTPPGATFVVNDTNDGPDADPGDGVCEVALGSGVCTLRAAIQETNTMSGADSIFLPEGIYGLVLPGAGEDASATGDLDITGDLTIFGTDASNTIIDGGGIDRVIDISASSAQVKMSNVTIRNGNTGDSGAGISNAGKLTLENSAVFKNIAVVNGGGIYNTGTVILSTVNVTYNASESGGGVYSAGVVEFDNSLVGNNTFIDKGGGVYNSGVSIFSHSSVNENINTNAGRNGYSGGGIYNSGQTTIDHSQINGNSSRDFGGGLFNDGLSSIATLNYSRISNNWASSGGGVENYSGKVELNYSLVSNNSAGSGGGILNGGELFSYGYGTTIVNYSSISGNSACEGAGVWNRRKVTFSHTTISGNTIPCTHGNIGGGGVYSFAMWVDGRDDASITFDHSTITNNSWGVYNGISSQATFISSTIFDNAAAGYWELDIDGIGGSTYLINSTLGNCQNNNLTSNGYNLIQDVGNCNLTGNLTGVITGVSPLVGPLQDNGGYTFTAALLPGSPAIDAGDPAGCTDASGDLVSVDQRGYNRSVDGDGDGTARCDIGAFEFGAMPLLSMANVSVIEGNGGTTQTLLEVTLSTPSPQTITVDYATADHSAVAPDDYSSASGKLTFAPGEIKQSILITIIPDTLIELDEDFNVILSNPENAQLKNTQAVVTILNDDQPVVSINDASQPEGNSGTLPMTFTISLSEAGLLPATLSYVTGSGSAKMGSDFFYTSGTVTFLPGETAKTLAITTIGDIAPENDESFHVFLGNPVNVTVGKGEGVGTLLNSDGTPPHTYKPWTFMILLAGDNNLEAAMSGAIREMEAMPANLNVNLVVLFDGGQNGDTTMFLVQPGGHYEVGVNKWLLGEKNTGDPQTLVDFIKTARDLFQAQHYALSIADHGRGTNGLAWDDTDSDHLTTMELYDALNLATDSGQTKIDVIQYDACLMGMLENAYQVKDFANYLVASQNLGWSLFPYAAYSQLPGQAQGSDPYSMAAVTARVQADTTPKELASQIADSYFAHPRLAGYPRTIATYDLSQVDMLTQKVDALAWAMLSHEPAITASVYEARSAAQKLDMDEPYYQITQNDQAVDLYDLAARIVEKVEYSDVQAAAQAVMVAIPAMVIAEHHESDTYLGQTINLDQVHGVSIFFPPQNAMNWDYENYINHRLFHFTSATHWDDFLVNITATCPGCSFADPVPPDPTTPNWKQYFPVIQR